MTQRVLNGSGSRTHISALVGNEPCPDALLRCKVAAKSHGHILGVWYPVSAQLQASICEACGAMVWVSRLGYEKHWRVGGTALEEDCPV